jgi:type IV pilus assembly protein PilO
MIKAADKQQAVIVLAAVIMLTGFGGLRYLPLFRQNQAMAARMQQQKQDMQDIQTHGCLLPELRHQKKLLEESLDCFAQKIPQGRDFARLWQQIADAMNACRLSDQRVQPGTEQKAGRLSCIPLTIECRGSMEQIFAFVKAVEEMDRLMRMDDLRLENSPEFTADLKMSARVLVYYQPDEQAGKSL